MSNSDTNPDTGARSNQAGSPPPGQGQKPYEHVESGNSGGSKQTEGGPGTAGSVTPSQPGPPRNP